MRLFGDLVGAVGWAIVLWALIMWWDGRLHIYWGPVTKTVRMICIW